MARVVVLAGDVPATGFGAREMARRLRVAGHDAVVARPAGVVAGRGGPAPAAGDDVEEVEVPALSVAGFRYRDLPRGQGRRAALGHLGLDRIQARLAELRPDLVVVDVELPEHTLAALALGVPVAGLSVFIDPWRRRGVPPHDSPTVPTGGLGSDAAIGLEWAGLLARRAATVARARIAQRGCDRLAVLRAQARRAGLGVRPDATQWLIPCLFPGLPVLVMSGVELDFPHRPRPEAQHVGPMVRELSGAGLDGRLGRVVAEARGAGRRLVYCSFGTFRRSYDPMLIDRVVSAVARHPGWQLVLALGGVDGVPHPTGLPPNVAVFDRVPQPEVLAAADLAVVHAGTTTLHECLLTGTPIVSYPTEGLADQQGNGARVAFHGLGAVGDRRADSTEVVEARMVAGLEDRACRARVEALGRTLASYRDRGAVEAAVEGLVAGAAG